MLVSSNKQDKQDIPLMFWYNKDIRLALPARFSHIYFTPATYAEYMKILLEYKKSNKHITPETPEETK